MPVISRNSSRVLARWGRAASHWMATPLAVASALYIALKTL